MSKIELSKKNYFHNLELLAKKCKGVDRLWTVLKDNAYGHGLREMATLSQEFGIKGAVVRDIQEAKEIEELFDKILILSDENSTQRDQKFLISVNSLASLKKRVQNQPIALKVDSGMHRNGLDVSELREAFDLIKKKNLKLEMVLTHYGYAGDLGSEFFWQRENWKEIKKKIRELLDIHSLKTPLFSSMASDALLRSKEMDDDIARCGIATYGYSSIKSDLLPVMSLWADRVSSKLLKRGSRVGYGGAYELERDSVVSVYDIGYGDGFFRYGGEGEFILPGGERVIGRVSMDYIAINSDKERVKLFEDAEDLSKRFNTISYDILVKLSPKIERVIV
jgi:alanine racemase